ncbi:MAG: hypothetical protein JXD21_06685 [Candidatus Omnitrophica bacterium]|nr:hypothetical protein [Candidatus Omnitrophota bacterium]
MINRIRGTLVLKSETKVHLDVGGICYEILIPKTVYSKLHQELGGPAELVVYYYFQIERNKSIPVMIGFSDELERDFFEKFISVSGIGSRVALKAFNQPIPAIAQAIESGNVQFLNQLEGIGKQKARQIVASLQGKVGRFALLQEGKEAPCEPRLHEIVQEAKTVLKRLQYSSREIETMVKKVLDRTKEISTVEDFLNLIYYEKQ